MKKAILLLVISSLSLFDLLHPGLPNGHDTADHVARIANFSASLSEGNGIPRWAANLNWGYGHPVLMFLYPLPSYMASLFHWIGFSLVDSTKLVFALSYVASIFSMYVFARAAWGAWPGIASAVLYGFAPYRFVDLYVRGAIGEHVAFIFPPIILWGMFSLSRSAKNYAGIAISLGTAGLILSHNAVSLMVLPMIALYGAYLSFFEAKNRMRFLLFAAYWVLTGFLLTAFFWVPAFFEGKYTLRDIVTKGDFRARFVPPLAFFIAPQGSQAGSGFTKEIGIVHWFSAFGAVMLLVGQPRATMRWFIGGSLLTFALSLVFMTAWSGVVWERVTILQKFQFPWRLLTVPVIVTSVLAAPLVAQVPRSARGWAVLCIVLAALATTVPLWRAKDYRILPETYYRGIYESTTDTGESSPIWSVRFMEKRPSALYEVVEGDAFIHGGQRTTTRHEFAVSARSDARIVDNTLYFPGWFVLVDNQNVPIEFQDPSFRGLITFRVPAGDHRIVVHFGETKLRTFANLVSLGGLALFLASSYATFRRNRYV